MSKPLAIRNNNPLNIRYSAGNRWIGQIGYRRGFCQFDTLEHGWRAALMLLVKYQRSGYDSIYKIIHRWAPPSENNTKAYIRFCVTHLFGSSDQSGFYDLASHRRITEFVDLQTLAIVMAHYECGVAMNEEQVRALGVAVEKYYYKPLKQ